MPIAEPISTFVLLSGMSLFFVFVLVAVARLLRPTITDKEEKVPYECGEMPSSPARNMGFGYYVYGVIYLAFEVSVAFVLLIAVSISAFPNLLTIGIMSALFAILSLGLVYFYRELRNVKV